MSPRFGVIDIGTLKVKLQIIEVVPDGSFKTLEQSNILTCLGCNMAEYANRPNPKNLQKLFTELTRCKQLLQQYHVSKLRVVSTHALREMGAVGQEIAAQIKTKTGLVVEIISQQEETNLFYQAVLGDFQTDEDFTVLDMGGGSAQILIGNRQKLKHSFLLKTGTSTLWDKFMLGNTGSSHPTKKQLRAMTDYVLQQLQPVPKNLHTPLIWGSSCIIDVFKGTQIPLADYSGSPTHPHKTSLAHLENFFRTVWKIPLNTREELYISPTPKYMWGMDMALTNVLELAKRVAAPYVIPSNSNINQGLLLSLKTR
jgi:exopolyphosphatase/pppGpp-phosphohydrolase